MAHQIIKQPDGNYSIWSTITESFLLEGLCYEGVLDFAKYEYWEPYVSAMQKKLNLVKDGKADQAYYPGVMTYGQACSWQYFRQNKVPLPDNYNEL